MAEQGGGGAAAVAPGAAPAGGGAPVHGHGHWHGHGGPSGHFDSPEHRHEAATLGMWIFLVTEVMFFGGLFLVYLVYRAKNPHAFVDASGRLDLWLGTINTVVLIGSSLAMALAVRGAQVGDSKATVAFLVLTIVLGSVFLAIKGVEYSHKFHDGLVPGRHFHYPGADAGAAQLFFSLYFAMTGLHAAHMVIGIGLLAVLAVMAARGSFSVEYNSPVENVGLYWHFVDIVWIFLFPLLYLIGRHAP